MAMGRLRRLAGLAQLDAPAQLVGTDAEVLGDLRHMLVGRVDDLLAEDARQRGLGNARAPVQLRRRQAVAVEQCFEYGGYVAFLHTVHNGCAAAQMQSVRVLSLIPIARPWGFPCTLMSPTPREDSPR